ncbi:LysR family transcriptional regulator [Pelagovum sp. HNIBRBA483]|uniref:LysR family transcriptional regulator n=1 Tax=Pelagovum sp. HNIBRBA483 TaxID=3233341 RepID=UPI0034A2F46D
MTLKLDHLRAFVTVADLGSFRRAAERLNTTQPNISARIAQLEKLLGTSLMTRDAGSVRLTSRGQSLLPHARAVLASTDDFLSAAGGRRLFHGALRLGVSELVAHTWLPAFLRTMKDRFPNIDVELTVDLSANITRALAARDIDLAFQSAPFDQPARISASLGRSPYVWVAAPTLALPAPKLDAATLDAAPILTHPRGTAPHDQLARHFATARLPARLVPATNNAVCLQMTLDRLGIACLPRAMLDAPLAQGNLIILSADWHPDPLTFAARYDLDPAPPYVLEAVAIAQDLSPPDDNKS